MKNIKNILKIGIILIFIGTFSCNNDEDSVIDTRPVAAFSVNETDVIEGDASIFTDLSFDQNGSITSWDWNFGDGTSSTEQSPVYTYAIGVYTVVLTVTDDSGNTNANEFSKVINVVEPSTATTEPTKLWVFNLCNFN
jgi:PKD repeat protein